MPIGNTDDLNSISFSPDRKTLLTADGNSAKLWEVATGALLTELTNATTSAQVASFSPDGSKCLVRGISDLTLFDARSSQPIKTFTSSEANIRAAQYSPDGKKLMTAWSDGYVKIYDANTNRLLTTWKGSDVVRFDDEFSGIHPPLIFDAQYSPDGQRIAFLTGRDSPPIIRDAATGKMLVWLQPPASDTGSVIINPDYDNMQYSPDGKNILVYCGRDSSFLLWNVVAGRLSTRLSSDSGNMIAVAFSPDGKKIATVDSGGIARIGPTADNKPIPQLRDQKGVNSVRFSKDGSTVITISDSQIIIRKATDYTQIKTINSRQSTFYQTALSDDGRLLAVSKEDNSIIILDIVTGQTISLLKGHAPFLYNALYTLDKKSILSATDEGSYLWDTATGQLKGRFVESPDTSASRAQLKWQGYNPKILSTTFSPDSQKILTTSEDSAVRVWDAATGNQLFIVRQERSMVGIAAFSPDGADVMTAFSDTIRVWNAQNGSLRFTITEPKHKTFAGVPSWFSVARYIPDGTSILTLTSREVLRQWDAKTGALTRTLIGADSIWASFSKYSPDGTSIFIGADHRPAIRNTIDGSIQGLQKAELWRSFLLRDEDVQYSEDGKKLAVSMWDTLAIYEVSSGKRICFMPTPAQNRHFLFSPDGRRLLTSADDNIIKLFDTQNGKLLYSFFNVDSSDYLVFDPDGRFDGTDAARKMVYYSCGTEIISLDQVKDQLWVPGLVQRINHHDPIYARKLSDLHICGFTPAISEAHETKDSAAWHFVIRPRGGGLGATVVYVNGNETRRYQPAQLKKIPASSSLALTIPKTELKEMFIPGQDNPVTVRAFTADDELVSRGATVTSMPDTSKHPIPNLYAVMVGVSDYKGTEIDLKYAAKDAVDLSQTIGESARKWLGAGHVFTYDLTTDPGHYRQPEKDGIRQTLEEISKKATASDILLIFFAGHGVMAGHSKKQFYFLTADASARTATGDSATVAQVGISGTELIDWIQPARIKAQKRILILDACNSGQAINDMITIGNPGQGYTAARGEDKAEEIRSIDKLNERSGLFILAASASSQSAYEMSRYSQGLLTYALLKTIKEDPAILENDRYLSVGPWFEHAARSVSQLVRDNGARQDPQVITTTQFDIGIVDSSVTRAIHLSGAGPLFTAANFSNTDISAGGDDLDLTNAVDKGLATLANNGNSARGTTAAGPDISYVQVSSTSNAWRLMGSYTSTGDSVTVTVNIWNNKKNLFHFRVVARLGKIDTVAGIIIEQALSWIVNHRPPD